MAHTDPRAILQATVLEAIKQGVNPRVPLMNPQGTTLKKSPLLISEAGEASV